MHALLLSLFAATGGLVLSGIVANLYRLLARKPKVAAERLFYMGVMTLAGPSVLIDNATRSFCRKDCSSLAYVFAVSLTVYWSFALGVLLIVLDQHL
jgi:hypothetical protein